MNLDLCTDGFHSDECPGCGLTAEERDRPANETNSAVNYGDGVAAERARITEAVRELDDDCHSYSGLRCDRDDRDRCTSINRAAVLTIVNPEETEHDCVGRAHRHAGPARLGLRRRVELTDGA